MNTQDISSDQTLRLLNPEGEVKERPILFSAPMVRALLAGTKTQTRRGPRGGLWHHAEPCGGHPLVRDRKADKWVREGAHSCPYGKPGDRLYVRESFAEIYDECDHPEMPGAGTERWHIGWRYRADGEFDEAAVREEVEESFLWSGWKPSIHMPRCASRITLEVTEVRVQRLQDISEEDAAAEGLERTNFEPTLYAAPLPGAVWETSAAAAYRTIWESINGAGSWDANPWVWAVSFKVLPIAGPSRSATSK